MFKTDPSSTKIVGLIFGFISYVIIQLLIAKDTRIYFFMYLDFLGRVVTHTILQGLVEVLKVHGTLFLPLT